MLNCSHRNPIERPSFEKQFEPVVAQNWVKIS